MKVTLALLQHACSADPAANLAKTLALAERAATFWHPSYWTAPQKRYQCES